MEGYLGYNSKKDRYGLLIRDLWEIDGFHCGECFDVLIDGEWVATRIEYSHSSGTWYLAGTELMGCDLEHRRIRVAKKTH